MIEIINAVQFLLYDSIFQKLNTGIDNTTSDLGYGSIFAQNSLNISIRSCTITDSYQFQELDFASFLIVYYQDTDQFLSFLQSINESVDSYANLLIENCTISNNILNDKITIPYSLSIINTGAIAAVQGKVNVTARYNLVQVNIFLIAETK